MDRLVIRVLGTLDIELAGVRTPVSFAARKCRALLAYLALSPAMTRSREHLADTFWDRSAEEQARASLRQALSSLRRALPTAEKLIRADADSVALDANAVEVDALQFTRFAQRRSAESLEAAAALYRGALLDGFSLREERFEHWLAVERRRYHEDAVQALLELVGHHARSDRHDRAIAVGERLVALDPLLESGHCALVRAYLQAGRRETALRQYDACARLLKQELGIAPGEELRQLAAQIGRAPAARKTGGPIHAIDEAARAPPAAAAPDSTSVPAAAERKQLTLLCARVRASPAFDDPDPEAALEHVDPVLHAIAEIAVRFGGTISQIREDGVTALFGAPVAQEDHALRACSAAVAMRDAIASQAIEGRDVRFVVHSGDAVVRAIGDERAHHYDAIGPAARLAAQLDATLAAGEIGITADTARRVEGFVTVDVPDAGSPRHVGAPIALYTLRAMAPLRMRWEARSARQLARFVGRDVEMELLAQLFGEAAAGAGRVAAIVGEAGIGKSRLVHEFVHARCVKDCSLLDTGTVSHETSPTYFAIAQLLRAWFGIATSDTQSEAAGKLHRGIEALDPALVPLEDALAGVLDLPSRDSQWPTLSPSQRHQRTMHAVTALVMRRSEAGPVILVVEDLHWVDPGTQAVLEHLVDRLAACRVLLILTHRPEYRHSWFARSYFTQIRLNPLGPDSADRLLQALLGTDQGLGELRRRLIARAGGTPLFLEESVRALVDSGALSGRPGEYRPAKAIDTDEIPSTVHAVLAARIDRLGAAQKSLLQTAAVIGQDVPVELLQPIAGIDAESMHEILASLQAMEFLYQTRLLPEPRYAFKHALTHHVAYAGVIRERRRALHRKLVELVETRYAARIDEHVERLAHHALGAGEQSKAVHYLLRSAVKAMHRSAHHQAIGYLKQGLELIGSLADARERQRHELDYRKAIGVATMAAKGWANAEVLEAFTRARALSQELGDERELFVALRGEGQYRMIGGETATARRLGERCVVLAKRSEDVGVQIETHHLFWTNSFLMGQYAEALAHSEKGLSLYERERDHALTYVYSGHDPGVCCRTFRALVHCVCGQPDRALEIFDDAVQLARRLDHPLTTAIACWGRGIAHVLRCEPVAARRWAEETVAISDEYLLPLTRSQGLLLLGWALARLGRSDEGIARMREGVAGTQATGAEMGLPYFLALLGEVLADAGRPDEGLKEIERAIDLAQRHDARFQFPEMLRLKGELLAMVSESNDAEAQQCYRMAIAMAESQGAKLPALRAATSLARALLVHGGAMKAREVLQPVFDCFAEGHETTACLNEAAALLAELQGRS